MRSSLPQRGLDGRAVEDLRKLPGGASREIWSLDAVFVQDGADARLPLVLRRDPGSTAVADTSAGKSSSSSAPRMPQGVPVPRPYWLAPSADGARRAVLSDGRASRARRWRAACCATPQYAERASVMTAQLGAHPGAHSRASTRRATGSASCRAPRPGESPAPAELERYEQIFRGIAPGAASGLRAGVPLAAPAPARRRRARVAGARRLPHRQRHLRPRGRARHPRLGAGAHRRSGRGSRLDVRARLALRQRRQAGRRHRRARRAVRRLRRRRRRAGRSRRGCASGRCSAT